MNVYVHAFKFREPFQVIVDDEIVTTSDKASFNLPRGLSRTIQGEVKPMITQCCMQALYKTNNQSAIDLAKTFERRRCNHPPSDPLTPVECIKSITLPDNKFKYVIATQHVELRNRMRTVPGVPFVFMKNSVMVMDSISSASLRYAEKLESSKLTGGLNDVKVGTKRDLEEEEDGEENKSVKPVVKKKKGPKGPNPLSVKKKKSKEDEKVSEKVTKTRRKRKHTRKEEKSGDGEENSSDDGGAGSDD
ncbi:hypothetical protein CANTEDRAFT_112567 [Yamadazyma tenuis ATCC 10573]|nr:uncharacterized protein CANTEDRAFT_112567 [Yamadazyma tenuis ATCC 10573]EGV66142.1 hypothetical protein CANTEDRAFT_112567 [Yamadazyma tenuis ATCC 10573]